jgi:SSS family transporter
MNTFNFIDYIVVGVYMLSMLVVGILVGRLNKGDQDYFKGGNKIPWLMSSMSIFIGAFTAYMFVAASGQAYKTGLACLLLFTSPVYGCIVLYFFFAYRWRRTRITSPMEYVQMRYGDTTRLLFSLIPIPIACIGIGNALFILSIFISSALGITGEYRILWFTLNGLQLCIIVTGIIIVLYTTVGGIWAVILTDTVQFIIVMVATSIILPLSFIALGRGSFIGGIQHFAANPPTPDYFHLIKPSQPFFFTIAWMCLSIFTMPGDGSIIQRMYSVPNEKDARKTIIGAGILFLLGPIIWVAPVFIMRPLLPDLAQLWPQLNNPHEATYVTITMMLLPNGMIGLMVSAILAATMSTVSVGYSVSSSIFVRDLYKVYISPRADTKELMYAGRILTFIYGIATIIVGFLLSKYTKASAFKTTFTIASYFGQVFTFPIAAGILIRRVPWWTALVSVVACLATTISLETLFAGYLAKQYPLQILIHIKENIFPYKIFGAFAVNSLVFFLCHYFYDEKKERNQRTDHFFSLIEKPISEDADAKLFIPNLKTYRIVGWICLSYGFFMILLYSLHVVDDPKAINLIAGLLFTAIFIIIQWLTSPRYSPFAVVRKQLSGKTD